MSRLQKTPTLEVVPPSADQPAVTLEVAEGGATWADCWHWDAHIATAWGQQLEAGQQATIKITHLPQWPEHALKELILFLAAAPASCRLHVDGTAFADVFEAILAVQVGPEQPVAQQRRWQDLVVEAAARCHPQNPELAAARIDWRLAQLGVPSIGAGQWRRRIRQCAAQLNMLVLPGAEASPRELIDDWLAALRDTMGLSATAPVISYWRDDWFMWEGRGWRPVWESQLRTRLVGHCHARGMEMASDRQLDGLLLNLKSATFLDDSADQDPPFRISDTDPRRLRPHRFLTLRNGVLDLGELAEGNPRLRPPDSHWFSPLALPVAYDAKATCPRWHRFLDSALPRSEAGDRRVDLLQEFFLDALLMQRHREKMLMLYGCGANGKSVVLQVAEALMGPANVSHVGLGDLADQRRIHALAHKLANITCEHEDMRRVDTAVLKQLISGEAINCARKFRSAVDVRSHALLVVACNRIPDLPPGDHGLWRRMTIMPFDKVFAGAEADVQLAQRIIESELPGVLNWAMDAAPRLLVDGFTACTRCLAAALSHRTDTDSVSQFVEDCCLVGENVPDPQRFVFREVLYTVYRAYCRQMGSSIKPSDRGRFGRRLRELWPQIHSYRPLLSDGRRPWAYTGIVLSPDGEALFESMGAK